MTRFSYRILFAVLTSMLLMPLAGQALAQDKDQSQGQAQSSGQTESRQPRAAGIQRQRQHMAALAQKLNLTEAQKEQFQQISKDMRKQGMAIRQDSGLTADQKKEKMLALRKQAHRQMFGVLTQEQKEQLKQMGEEHKKGEGKEKSSAIRRQRKRMGETLQVMMTILLPA